MKRITVDLTENQAAWIRSMIDYARESKAVGGDFRTTSDAMLASLERKVVEAQNR